MRRLRRAAASSLLTTLLILTAAGAAAASEAVAPDDQEFADRLGTLQLDRELEARGNLGGVTVDRLGFLYVANFRDKVWRISPEGQVETLSRTLYGASGNAVDSRGDLYQANFLGQTIDRISRDGTAERYVDRGLAGPVGLVFDRDDTLYVCNCTGNYLSRVTPGGAVERFAESDLFACPNGITLGPDDHLYVTNFNHHDILRVSKDGRVEKFANLPGGAGNAHLVFSRGFFYVTKIVSNRLMKVALDGQVFAVAGTGQRGEADGPALTGTLASPNGIAVSPQGDRLYVNTLIGEYNRPEPARIAVRTVDLMTLTKALDRAAAEGGSEAVESAYRRYAEHPVRGREDTVGEMIAYGYRLLSNRKVPEALQIFGLNARQHPDSATAQYQLGEAFRYAGQRAGALEQYRKVLAIDPEHAGAAARLQQLGSGDGEPDRE